MTDWLPGAERDEQDGGVTLNRSLPPRAVWHITWDALTESGAQPDFDAVANYLKRMAYCPHLMWDPWTGRTVQFYPASVGGRALSDWNQDGSACIQIETFFSPGAVRNGKRYDTVADTPCKGLSQILEWLDGMGIPRTWPLGAPQWQSNSRDPEVWNANAGHYGHSQVPDNTHTDPGPMPALGIKNSGGSARPIDVKGWFAMATPKEITDATAAGLASPAGQKAIRTALINELTSTRGRAALGQAVWGLVSDLKGVTMWKRLSDAARKIINTK